MDKERIKDIAYTLTKAGVGSIPVIGTAASEILSLIVASPLEKRREKWFLEIGEKLKELEENNDLQISELSQNEIFIDIVIQTTQNALKTSNELKRRCYKNILINSASEKSIDEAEIQIYINLIDSFTDWHIKIFVLFDNPTNWYKERSKDSPNLMMGSLTAVLVGAFPELEERIDFYNLIWTDLHKAGLVNTSSLGGTISGSGLMVNRSTPFGIKFLKYINE